MGCWIHWPDVVDRAREIVVGYDGDVTLRQVHYRLVAAGLIPNTLATYRGLSARLTQAWREDRFPGLVDTLPRTQVPRTWPDAGAFLADAPDWFRLDRTRGQEHAVYVAAEKDTLRLMFADWLADFGIPVLMVRGFAGQRSADVVRNRTSTDPRPPVLLYVGDLNCSAADMERDWVTRTGHWAHIERVMLTYAQILAYELPAAEGNRDDPRWPRFAARYGLNVDDPVQWEVEALDPTELQRLVMAAVHPYVDRAVLAAVLTDEARQRRALDLFVARWPDARGGRGEQG
ncbi:hypothetical protein [Streptosporangium sp. NPDC000396]|uniref:hypothetical protein n=1 Tax=Streptosporangium sp. NPDC000396 TaxID=3366185 RepID=UPI0036C13962